MVANVRLAGAAVKAPDARVRLAGVIGGDVGNLAYVRLGGAQATQITSAYVRLAGARASTQGPRVRIAFVDAASIDGDFILPQMTANAGADRTVNAGAIVTLDGSGSGNPDGPIFYQWDQIGGIPVTLSAPSAVNPVFTAPTTGGALTFRLTVSDGTGATVTDNVVITVGTSKQFLLGSVIAADQPILLVRLGTDAGQDLPVTITRL